VTDENQRQRDRDETEKREIERRVREAVEKRRHGEQPTTGPGSDDDDWDPRKTEERQRR
jgi:hypothetical protein